MKNRPAFSLETAGDRCVVARFPGRPTRELSAYLIAFARDAREIENVVDAVPGHRTVLIETVPGTVAGVAERTRALDPTPTAPSATAREVLVRYDGADLDWAVDFLDMDRRQVVRMHTSTTYDVRLIGSPGFIYLSQAPARLHMPRRDEPRRAVPAGSVGIGGRQAGIYGRAMPGGWRLLGTALEIPALAPGDRVRFRAVP